MSSGQVSADTVKQLYNSLLELKQVVNELENSGVVAELDKKFGQLESVVRALSDFVEQNPRAWYIGVYDDNEIEITHSRAQVSIFVEGDASMSINSILEKFFSSDEAVNKIIKAAAESVGEITDLIKRNINIYERIAKLNGRIDQLYYDIRRLCPQQDP